MLEKSAVKLAHSYGMNINIRHTVHFNKHIYIIELSGNNVETAIKIRDILQEQYKDNLNIGQISAMYGNLFI